MKPFPPYSLKLHAAAFAGWMLAAVSVAIQPGAPQESASAEGRVIRGKVIRAADGQPVAGVEIRVFGAPQQAGGRTDELGAFIIRGLPPGKYGLMVVPWSGYRAPEIAVDLRSVPGIDGIVIPLRKSARVSGRIVDKSGKGWPKIRVSAVRDPGWNPWRVPDRAAASLTDDDGKFVLEGLDQGSYLLLAEPPPAHWAQKTWSTDEALPEPGRAVVPAWYPGVPERLVASPVSLASGEEKEGLQWELAESRVYCVQSKAPACPREADGAVLELTSELYLGSASMAKEILQPGQEWEVCGLAEGQYVLTATCPAPEGPPLNAIQVLEVRGQSRRIPEMELRPPISQKLSVRIEGGEKAAVPEFPSPMRIWVTPLGRPLLEFEKPMLSLTRAGPAEIGPIAGGPNLLKFRTPPGCYVASATITGRDVLRTPFEPGEDLLEIVVRCDGAELSIQTVDPEGRPFAFADVLIGRDPLPDPPAEQDLFLINSGQNGFGALSGLPPGNYRILGLPPGLTNLVNAASTFRVAIGDAERIRIEPAAKVTRRLVIRPIAR